MRLVVTGQIGLDKKQYLEQLAALARERGESLRIYHIGDMMYREAPDVPPGRILDLPLSRLNSLRRAVFRDVLAEMSQHKHIIINTHATFRWKHGLFAAFDFDQLAAFDPDLYVTLVDNIETVHAHMVRDQPAAGPVEHSLKDLMVWREEEILATEILAKSGQSPVASGQSGASGPWSVASGQNAGAANPADHRPLTTAHSPSFYVLARGRAPTSTVETLFRLMFRPNMKKVYPSFPMTHIYDLPETLAEVNAFRAAIAEKFITFDPGDVDEKLLADAALAAAKEGHTHLEVPITNHQLPITSPSTAPPGDANAGTHRLKVADILSILPDIDGQIYARDFLLVRQADLVISYIPELPPAPGTRVGKPGLSSGVERELQHAHDHGRETYVIWKPAKDPSPFITQTANKVFRSTEEAMTFFEAQGYFHPHSLFAQ